MKKLPEEVKQEIWIKLSSGKEEQFDKKITMLLKALEPPKPEFEVG